MGRCGRLWRLGFGCFLTVVALGCKQERVDPTEEVFADFSKRVDEYAALRNHLSDSVGPIQETMSQAEITVRATSLGDWIRAARGQAKPGDIFTPEVAAVIATLIKEEYSRRPFPVLETREDQQEELPNFIPEVNAVYPTTYPLATFPPALLPILPRLPEQVEYRIVQHYLILRDIEANLIVDLMPRAVPYP